MTDIGKVGSKQELGSGKSTQTNFSSGKLISRSKTLPSKTIVSKSKPLVTEPLTLSKSSSTISVQKLDQDLNKLQSSTVNKTNLKKALPFLKSILNNDTSVKADIGTLNALDKSISEKVLNPLKQEHTKLSTETTVEKKDIKKFDNGVSLGKAIGINSKGFLQGYSKHSISRSKNVYLNTEIKAKQMVASVSPKSDLAMAVSLKSESELKDMITQELGKTDDRFTGNFSDLSSNRKKLVNSIVKGMRSGLPNKAGSRVTIEGKSITGSKEDIQVPKSITLNGKKYDSPKYLAQGGLGRVIQYSSKDNPNEKIVVKDIKINESDDKSEKRQEMVNEVIAHKQAFGDDSNGRVVGLKGTINTGEDSLLMVMDFVDGGDMDGLNDKISDLLENSKITPKQSKLLSRFLLRGAIEGMQYVQTERNMQHLDLKPQNFMMNSEGDVQVADFGSSKVSHDKFTDKKLEATFDYASPEVTSRSKDSEDVKLIDHKSDTWTLGMMMNVATGDNKLYNKFRFRTENNITEFGNDDNNRMKEVGSEKKMLTSEDNIINAMMHPDPSQRPNLETVLNHSFFSDPELNSPELRGLLKAIISGNETDIAKFKDIV